MGRGANRTQVEFPACGKRNIVSGMATICAQQTAKDWRKTPKGVFRQAEMPVKHSFTGTGHTQPLHTLTVADRNEYIFFAVTSLIILLRLCCGASFVPSAKGFFPASAGSNPLSHTMGPLFAPCAKSPPRRHPISYFFRFTYSRSDRIRSPSDIAPAVNRCTQLHYRKGA